RVAHLGTVDRDLSDPGRRRLARDGELGADVGEVIGTRGGAPRRLGQVDYSGNGSERPWQDTTRHEPTGDRAEPRGRLRRTGRAPSRRRAGDGVTDRSRAAPSRERSAWGSD